MLMDCDVWIDLGAEEKAACFIEGIFVMLVAFYIQFTPASQPRRCGLVT
jgi:hypothetical protein